MGTTADKLNAVLASKNAIKTKFNLADDLPFSQYADNIESGTDVSDTTATAADVLEGKKFYDADGQPTIGTLVQCGGTVGGGEFYLCSYVNRNYFSYNTIVVSGMPTDAFVGATYTDQETWESADVPADIASRDPNGTYTLTNPDDKYPSNFVWQSANGCLLKTHPWGSGFVIYPGDYDDLIKYLQYSNDMGSSTYPVPDDYTSYSWSYYDGSSTTTVEGGSVVVPEHEAVEQYWEGYKLNQNEDGKYDYAVETTRLTYADYMPVAGRIYDGGCTMEITNVDLSDDALWSCPRNMTSTENDEWVITASGQEYSGSEYAPLNAFDGDLDTKWHSNYAPLWIQWQNKNKAVAIGELHIYCSNWNDSLNYNCFLMASNDGENWVTVIEGNFGTNAEGMGVIESVDGVDKLTLPVPCPNEGALYRYWRFGKNQSSSGNFMSKIYQIEAYSQLSREVPK